MALIEIRLLILTIAVVASAAALLATVVRLGTPLRLMEERTVEIPFPPRVVHFADRANGGSKRNAPPAADAE